MCLCDRIKGVDPDDASYTFTLYVATAILQQVDITISKNQELQI